MDFQYNSLRYEKDPIANPIWSNFGPKTALFFRFTPEISIQATLLPLHEVPFSGISVFFKFGSKNVSFRHKKKGFLHRIPSKKY